MTRTAFDEIREDEYSVSHEAAQLGLLLVNRHPEFEHLQGAAIAYVFRDDELRRHGRVTVAECIMVERILQTEKRWGRLVKWALGRILGTTELPDFLVLIDAHIWAGLSPEHKLALMHHELMHAWVETEDDGETPKLTKDGRFRWAIRGHDVEDFTATVERFGLWNEDLVAMARAIVDSLAKSAEAV